MTESTKIESLETAKEEKTAVDPEQNPEEEKKYTDADLDKIIARKVARERARLSKLLETEQQESDLEKRERELKRRETMADMRDRLQARGYPYKLAEVLNYNSEEELEESFEYITAVFSEALSEAIKRHLVGPTPKASITPPAGSLDDKIREAFSR